MKEGVYEFGDARVVIKSAMMMDQYTLWLLYKDHVVTMDDGSMVLEKLDPSVQLDESYAFLTWEGSQDITTSVFELFNALAIAVGGGARDADDAYERGRLEGENKILREWNESMSTKPYVPPNKPADTHNNKWQFPYTTSWDSTTGVNNPTYNVKKLNDVVSA